MRVTLSTVLLCTFLRVARARLHWFILAQLVAKAASTRNVGPPGGRLFCFTIDFLIPKKCMAIQML